MHASPWLLYHLPPLDSKQRSLTLGCESRYARVKLNLSGQTWWPKDKRDDAESGASSVLQIRLGARGY